MVAETYWTPEELRASFRAARKPGEVEDWAFRHVERLLDRLDEVPADSDSPTCVGRWLVFTSPGSAPVIYTVSEDDLIKYSTPNGYLWWGPLPECVGDVDDGDVDDAIDSPPINDPGNNN